MQARGRAGAVMVNQSLRRGPLKQALRVLHLKLPAFRLDAFAFEGRPRKPAMRGVKSASEGIPRNRRRADRGRSEEHTSELQSLMRISYAVFGLKKTNTK